MSSPIEAIAVHRREPARSPAKSCTQPAATVEEKQKAPSVQLAGWLWRGRWTTMRVDAQLRTAARGPTCDASSRSNMKHALSLLLGLTLCSSASLAKPSGTPKRYWCTCRAGGTVQMLRQHARDRLARDRSRLAGHGKGGRLQMRSPGATPQPSRSVRRSGGYHSRWGIRSSIAASRSR